MRLPAVILILALVLLSACNLSSEPVTPTGQPTQELPEVQATSAPTLTPMPGTAATTTVATRTPFNNNAPTTQPLAGTGTFVAPITGERAEITSPTNGASVGGAPLYVSGVIHNLPEDKFSFQVFDSNDQPLSVEQTVPLSNPNHAADIPWTASVTLRFGYTGAAQIRISARLADGTTGVIATTNVTIIPATAASVVQPVPGGFAGSITAPSDGMSVIDNPIRVMGTAGGLADNQFTLLLLDGSGTVINSIVVTTSGAETNSVPWSASLGTSNYRGNAEIRAVATQNGQQVTIASVKITLQ